MKLVAFSVALLLSTLSLVAASPASYDSSTHPKPHKVLRHKGKKHRTS